MKIYDVVNYDMMVMMRLPFVPGAIEWVYKQGDVKVKLAISERNSSFVHIYDAHAGGNEPIISREVLIDFLVAFPLLLVLNFMNCVCGRTHVLFFADLYGASRNDEVQSGV